MDNKKECKIVQDLLPSYVDNLTQNETNDFLENHLKNCEECSRKLEKMKSEFKLENKKQNKKEIDYMKKVRKKIGILKIISTSILTLIILTIVFVICNYFFIRYDGKIDKSGNMTEEEILSLLEKGRENKNYYLEVISLAKYKEADDIFYSDIQSEYFAKDGVILNISNGGKIYYNYNTNEEIFCSSEIDNEYKTAYVTTLPEDNNYKGLDFLNGNNIDSKNYFYKYIGEKEINGKKYIVVDMKSKPENEDFGLLEKVISNLFSNRVFINKDTGIIEKTEMFVFTNFTFQKLVEYYNIQLNCITDGDVERPNLSGYVVLEAERAN